MTRRYGDVRSRAALTLLALFCLLAAGLATVVSPPARAETIGAVPTGRPNVPFGCEAKISVIDGAGNLGFFPSGAGTCTYFQSLPFGAVNTLASGYAPRNGAITSARVRSGPNPAPIRFTVLRGLAKLRPNGTIVPGSSSCCFGRARTRLFRLRPNRTTTIPLNLSVRNFKDRKHLQAVSDVIGISAVANQGTLPLRTTRANPNTSDYTIPGNPSVGWFFPEIRPGQIRVDGSGAPSHRLTANFGFCSGTPSGRVASARGRGSRTACRVRTMSGTVRVVRGQARVPVACTGLFGRCAGRITITTPRRPFRVLGARGYFLRPARQKTFFTGLNRRGRAKIQASKRVPARIRITASKGRTSVRRVTLVR